MVGKWRCVKMAAPDHPLWNPELDALLVRHNRMEGRFPLEHFPYDMAGVIADWLRDHELDDIADGVAGCDPQFLGTYIAGARSGYAREMAVIDAILK